VSDTLHMHRANALSQSMAGGVSNSVQVLQLPANVILVTCLLRVL